MVVPVDVSRDGEFDVVDAAPAATAQDGVADALGLEQRIQRLGHRVVVAVAPAADRGDGVGLGESFGVAHGSILHAAVAVVDQAGGVLAGAAAAHKPMSRASRARSVRRLVEVCQPTIIRE